MLGQSVPECKKIKKLNLFSKSYNTFSSKKLISELLFAEGLSLDFNCVKRGFCLICSELENVAILVDL